MLKDEATCKGELPAKGSKSSKATPRPGKSSGTAGAAGAAGDPAPAAIIRVHHALATSAPDYTKKQNVFRLYTADRAQFLIQTSDSKVSFPFHEMFLFLFLFFLHIFCIFFEYFLNIF